MSKYLGRGIHNKIFYDSLTNGKLQKMVQVVINDLDLDIQIRNNYLNIYYKGGNIAKVTNENSVYFDKFYFYLEMKVKPKNIVLSDIKICNELKSLTNELLKKFQEENYEEYFRKAKFTIDKWLEKNPKAERMDQHKLSLENQYKKSDYTIIDLEYEVSTKSEFKCTHIPLGKIKPKKPRFDIIAVDKLGKLCIIEFKKGKGSLSGTSGLKEHWDCYRTSIGNNSKPFMEEMKALLAQKKELKLIDKNVEIIDQKPEFIFAYSYDDKASELEQDKIFNKEYNSIGEKIKVIKLSSNSFVLKD